MANLTNKSQSYGRLSVIALLLMLLVGALIVILDWHQVIQLVGNASWHFTLVALGFVVISYFFASASVVTILRVFGVNQDHDYLFRVGFVSTVFENLIAHPVGLSFRLLVLRRRGVTNSQIIGSSLLLSYFKNIVFYALIPVSLVYIAFSYPLFFGGLLTIILFIVILVVSIVVATIIVFGARARTLILRFVGRIWRLLTHRDIKGALNQFGSAVTEGIAQLKRQPGLRLALATLILGDVASTLIVLWFCFAAFSVPVHLGVLITGFSFGITLTVISFIPGDVGIQEASMAGIFALFGVPFGQGVLVAILFRVLYYFIPFVCSLGFYWHLLREVRENKGLTP